MIKTLVNDTLKNVREMRIANADGTAAQYIGEMYVANEDGTGVEKIFDAGWDTTVTGNVPLSLPNARPKPTSWQINGNSKRSITIDGKEYVVPDGITLLESATAAGIGFVLDFGITPKLTSKARIIFTPIAGNNAGFGGARKDADYVRFSVTTFSSGAKFAFAMTGNTWSNNKTDLVVGQRYDCTAYNGKQIINGTEYNETVLASLNNTDATFKICAIDGAGGAASATLLNAKYEIVYLWEGETPVLLGHPAIKNGVVGYYDLVTGGFIAPTVGTLTAGSELPMPTNPLGVYGVGNSGLPSGYKKLEYIQSSGTQYIDTGVIPDNTTGFKVKMAVPETVSDIFRFGCRQNSNDTRFIIGTMAGSAYLGFGNTLAPIAAGSWAITQNTQFVAQLNYLNDRHAYINDIISSTDPIRDMSETTFTYPLIMFGRNSAGSIASSAQTIYSCEITKGSELVRNFIPAQNASNVVGMYDLVTDTFFTNDGTGDFTAGPEDTSCVVPILQANNCGMVDMGTLSWNPIGNGCFYAAITGKANGRNIYCSKYPTDQSSMASATANMHIGGHDGNRVYFKNTSLENTRAAAQADLSGVYLYYQRTTDDTWTTPTTTNLYLPKQLQKVGAYADDATSGGVLTSRVGVKVFDGTEEWQIGQSFTDGTYRTFLYMSFPSVDSATLCSHFEQGQFSDRNQANQGNKFYINTTSIQIRSTQFDSPVSAKSWLAAQYAAGTPVIIYYPLATATETSVTVPSISTARGDNYLDVTTEVKPTASATYRKRTQ